MTAIFYHGDEQKRLATERRDREAGRGKAVYVEIVPASKFYPAEDYHQKYYLRRRPELIKALMTIFPSEERMINSGAAARLNGYVAGYNRGDIEAELQRIGLSAEETSRVMSSVAEFVH